MTALSLSGMLLSASDGSPVAGYRVTALATRRVQIGPEAADTIDTPASGSGVSDNEGKFAFDVPGDGQPVGTVAVAVAAQDGARLFTADFTLEKLRNPLRLKVEPPARLVINPSDDPTGSALVTLTGRIIDATGKLVAAALPIVIWGKSTTAAGEQPRPLVISKTQAGGYFSGGWVADVLNSAFATVDGKGPIAVPLADNRLPRRVMLVLEAEEGEGTPLPEAPVGDNEHPPRNPDPIDLTANPEAFSQDLGRGCIDLCTPNRVIEEFTYSTVVRTSEPDVKGLTIGSRPIVPPRMLAQLVQASAMQEVMLKGKASADDIGALADLRIDVDTARQLASGDRPPALADIKRAAWLSEVRNVKDLLGVTVSGASVRQVLDADSAIDWDDTPTVFQAVSIARGHVLQYREVWRADGYSLGDLLYSLPLAPGQRRQVAIVDWERRSATRRDEALEFEEQLEAFVSRDRDVSEIVGSRLGEENAGASSNTTWGVAGGIGAGFIGSGFGIFGGVAGSSGGSSSTAWSEGSRRFSADTLQSLRDRVMQRASSVRDQRSTVVQTAAQGESLRTETETVANYNRCHAMTVEYFEVLRHFAVSHELADVRECLFVPLPMSEFTAGKALRWQTPLVAYLRDRPLLPGFSAMRRIADNWQGWDYPVSRYSEEAPQDLQGELRISFILPRPRDTADGAFQVDMWDGFRPYLWMDPYELWTKYLQTAVAAYNAEEIAKRDREFRTKVAPELARAIMDRLRFFYVASDGSEAEVPLDATLVSRYAEGVPLYVSLRPRGPLPPIPREQIAQFKIVLDGAELPPDAQLIVQSGKMRYSTEHKDWLLFSNSRILNDLGNSDAVYVSTPTSFAERRNPRQEDRQLQQRLLAHLNANLEYYHQLIWTWLDAERRFMLLDGILVPGLGGKSVASIVENRLIGIAGNSLIMPVAPGLRLDARLDPESKGDLMDLYAADARPPVRISVPTRGVYAEAIQGQCIACEEIDDSRYWRWSTAGMLDLPTIEPVGTGSRADPEQPLTPTPLAAPLVQIQNAPALPAPAGLAEVFKMLAQPDLFTDIAGLAGTQKNAQAGFDAALSAAAGMANKAADLARQNFAARDGERMLDRIGRARKDGLLTDDAAQQLSGQVFGAMTGTPDEKAEKKADSPVKDPEVQKALKAVPEADKASVKVSSLDEAVEVNYDNSVGVGGQGSGSGGGGGGGSAGSGSGGGSGTGTAPPVATFPAAYVDPLDQQPGSDLQNAFDAAVAALSPALKNKFSRVAMTIVAANKGTATKHPAAGIRQDVVHYSASLLKVAAMYASFELRKTAQRLAEKLKLNDSGQLVRALNNAFASDIRGAVPRLAGMSDAHLLPSYAQMLGTVPDPGGGSWLTFDFTADYQTKLDGMIPGGHNGESRDCIHAVGYGFLNGALAKGGFFDGTTGIWLAGDFMRVWPYRTIASDNDGQVAQAATTRQLAKLFTLIHDGTLVDADSSASMRGLIGRAGSWLHFNTPKLWSDAANSPFRVVAAKVGRGPLKAGGEVISEAEFVRESSENSTFVVVWQNLLGPPDNSNLKAVSTVIEKTIKAFLAP